MKRLQLFEFLDQSWLPGVFRDAGVAFLETMYRINGNANKAFGAKLAEVMRATGEREVLDLCSGGAGPILQILPVLRKAMGPVDVTLSDLFPTRDGSERVAALADSSVRYMAEPVDATCPPESLRGLRTIFGAFHHLEPKQARAVLADAFHKRRTIAIFEVTTRKPSLLLYGAFMPLVVFVVTPMIRPLRASQLLFTYAIPVMPFLIMWDGSVSVLRTYTPDELREMTADLQADDYRWEIGEMRVENTPAPLPYVIGMPLAARA